MHQVLCWLRRWPCASSPSQYSACLDHSMHLGGRAAAFPLPPLIQYKRVKFGIPGLCQTYKWAARLQPPPHAFMQQEVAACFHAGARLQRHVSHGGKWVWCLSVLGAQEKK
eukprot:scaffold58574_cov19-Tisochrysis_lutea.AAC.1